MRLTGPAASANTLQGNHVGIDPAGSQARANSSGGIILESGANFNLLRDNLISGNNSTGVMITGASTNFNRVSGGRIGTNLAGTAAIANKGDGVRIQSGASHNVIGTDGDGVDDATEGVLISGNRDYGVNIYAGGADHNRVSGNRIGTNAAGTGKLANLFEGVVIHWGPRFNIIGTNGDGVSDELEGNLISGHSGHAVVVARGGTDFNVIAGNRIGTTADGLSALGNSGRGVWVFDGARNTRIGTDGDGFSDEWERNVISSGGTDGVLIQDAQTRGTRVMGNSIGTDATGSAARGNAGQGVNVTNATETFITANTIAFNKLNGVAVIGASATGNAIRFNSIHSNGQLGIDLGNNGKTANDPLDADAGPNRLQNHPILERVIGGPETAVVGGLRSLAASTFLIDLYANPAGGSQGKRHLGSTTVTTGPDGHAEIKAAGLAATFAGETITATATDLLGNTSEFSAALTVPARMQSVVVNGGDSQRSRVTNLTLTLNGVVALSGGAISLTGTKGLVNATWDLSGSTATNTVAKLTFNADANSEAGSLYDGRFVLGVSAAKVAGAVFDGNGDGLPGDDYASSPDLLHRLFGDVDGNAAVNFSDFLSFRTAFGSTGPTPPYSNPFDHDNNNEVNFIDFLAFRSRFGSSI